MTPLLTAGTNYVYHARAESLLRWLPDASVDCILTDPPFNVGKASWDSWSTVRGYLDWLDMHLAQFRRVLKPNGSLYLFCATKHAAKVELTVEKHFNVLNNIRWRKDNGWHKKAAEEDLRAYFPASESIIFAEQWGSDKQAVEEAGYEIKCQEACARVFQIADLCAKHKVSRANIAELIYSDYKNLDSAKAQASNWILGKNIPNSKDFEKLKTIIPIQGDYLALRREYEDLRREYEDLRRPFFGSEHRPYTDVWEYPTVNTYPGKHPCEKPLDMLRDIIQTSSREGDVVLDPFAGSGSTLVAAKELKRRYIGGDFDGHWVKRTNARLALPQQLELFAA